MKKKALVLLSGGLDSTVSLASALKNYHLLSALTFDYGQKSAQAEIKAAQKISHYYKIQHRVIDLPWLKEISKSALTDPEFDIPLKLNSVKQVWVPNRNGVFLAIAASFAEALSCDMVITGFNKEEARAFPDNSMRYILAANEAFKYSTLNKVQVDSFTKKMTKIEIVKKGLELNIPFHHIYSCYIGKAKMCGKCESCRRLINALEICRKED